MTTIDEVRQAAALLGRRGGLARSDRKKRAVTNNSRGLSASGKKAGRPPGSKDSKHAPRQLAKRGKK